MSSKHDFCSQSPLKSSSLDQDFPQQTKSTRRIERKPLQKPFQSPKHNIYEAHTDHLIEEKSFMAKMENLTYKSPAIRFNVSSISRSICYLAPKNVDMSEAGESNHEKSNNNQDNLSIQDMQNKQKVEINQNLEPTIIQKVIRRKPLCRSSKYTPKSNSGLYGRGGRVETSDQKEELERQVQLLRGENKQLLLENTKLSQRINELNQQKQYLYQQIQKLNSFISQQKQINERFVYENKKLSEQIEDDRRHIEEFKIYYKLEEDIKKNYQIMERMYLKIKHENEILTEKNKNLGLQNEKLQIRVSALSKMIDEVPLKPKNPRSKSKGRELSPVYNKENCISNLSFQPPSTSNPKADRLTKSNRRDENFFELSPE